METITTSPAVSDNSEITDSILISVKKMLGIAAEYEHFDPDIIMHINTVLAILTQIGAGPSGGFFITDQTATWNDFIQNDPRLEFVKSYVFLKVRLIFDPPLSSSVTDAINRQISELEWRIYAQTDLSETITGDNNVDI